VECVVVVEREVNGRQGEWRHHVFVLGHEPLLGDHKASFFHPIDGRPEQGIGILLEDVRDQFRVGRSLSTQTQYALCKIRSQRILNSELNS
jgi:hypothetical protein